MGDLAKGCTISLTDGRMATVRFIGNTHFADGEWIGVELEDATGKNDGAVQGERYFDCEQGFGMFVRPTAVAEVLSPPKKEVKSTPKAATNGTATKSRPPSAVMGSAAGGRRPSVLGSTANKRQSLSSASPTPAPKTGMGPPRSLRSPTKSPTKQLSAAPTATSTPRASSVTSRPSSTNPSTRPSSTITKRTSTGAAATTTPVSRTTRPTAVAPSRTTRPGSVSNPASKRLSTQPPLTRRVSPGGNSNASSDKNEDTSSPGSRGGLLSPRSEVAPRTSAPLGSQRVMSGTASAKEVEDLKTKLRLMEKKRQEDRDKLKALDQAQADRDKFESIIQKLQSKYQPQQQEVLDLRKKIKETETTMSELEKLQAESESVMEMATLDREMAEETADALKSELEALRLKNEELELEVEVLREENAEYGQVMSPEEKSSHGWLQMEKSNERLREALIRLRDLTQQTEADMKSQIKELEDEVEEYRETKAQLETTQEKLLNTESTLEHIRQQLDTALGAEEMIEELAEKNMQQQETIENLRATVEDLESLQELNDELEINHVEAEKQLQEEIDYRESVHNEQIRKMAQQDESIGDLEYTLARFRELVTNLQSDLEDMRASQQISETEAHDLTSRSRAMMDLNLKLQASASKTQLKTIDMELGRMNAQEAVDNLEMIKLFLPDTFSVEKDPILAVLRLKRVSFKATLMHNVVRDRIADQVTLGVQEHIFTAYDILEELTWISSLCDRFVSFINACSVEDFARMSEALYELDPVERALNAYIEGLKKNELDENRCSLELSRSMALLSHLAEKLIPSSLESFADDIHMRALLMQSYLENTAAALSQIKSIVQSKMTTTPENEEEVTYFGQKLDGLSSQARSGKVIGGKIARSLEELKSRSLSLPEDTLSSFESTKQLAKRLSDLSKSIGQDVIQLIGEEGRADPYTYQEFLGCMLRNTTSFSDASGTSENNDAILVFTNGLKDLLSQLDGLSSLSTDLSHTTEFERKTAPWIVRAQQLQTSKVIPPDADEEIRRLKAEVHETTSALGAKDQTLEEQSIKIELLESRMRDASKKAASVKELESLLEAAKAKEVEILSALEKQTQDYNALEEEVSEYKTRLEQVKRSSIHAAGAGAANGVVGLNFSVTDQLAAMASARELESLRLEVNSLQAAIRFLKEEDRRLRLLDSTSVEHGAGLTTWLDVPLRKTQPTPEEARARKSAAEAQDVLDSLVSMTRDAKIVDLAKSVPQDAKERMAWRPVKSTPRYHVLRQREDFEKWAEWKKEILGREKEREMFASRKRDLDVAGRLAQGSKALDRKVLVGRAWKMMGLQGGPEGKIADFEGTQEVRIVG